MTEHFVIGGDRKLGIAVTVGVKDSETLDGPRWPWGAAFWTLVGAFGLACLLMALSGLPYWQTGGTYCSLGTVDRPCGAPVSCHYTGLQGQRHLRVEDAGECPAIVFLPWHIEPLAQKPMPPAAPLSTRKSRRSGKASDYGTAGPPLDRS